MVLSWLVQWGSRLCKQVFWLSAASVAVQVSTCNAPKSIHIVQAGRIEQVRRRAWTYSLRQIDQLTAPYTLVRCVHLCFGLVDFATSRLTDKPKYKDAQWLPKHL